MPISSPSLLAALPLNQGPFPPPALPGFFGSTGLSAIPHSPASPSRVAGWLGSRPTSVRDFPCCHRAPCANMPSPMPRRTRAVLASLSSRAMSAFPVLKPGRHSHHMVSGLARCSFALRPARSLTPSFRSLLRQGLRTLRCLCARLDCYRLERKLPGGTCTR